MMTDDDLVRRTARRLEQEADRLQQDALESGALPDDFTVVHVFKAYPALNRLTTPRPLAGKGLTHSGQQASRSPNGLFLTPT